MNLNTFIWLSHKTGVTFFMRVIFLTGIRALAFCVLRSAFCVLRSAFCVLRLQETVSG
jgi:hypothetical protein